MLGVLPELTLPVPTLPELLVSTQKPYISRVHTCCVIQDIHLIEAYFEESAVLVVRSVS